MLKKPFDGHVALLVDWTFATTSLYSRFMVSFLVRVRSSLAGARRCPGIFLTKMSSKMLQRDSRVTTLERLVKKEATLVSPLDSENPSLEQYECVELVCPTGTADGELVGAILLIDEPSQASMS
mmetsp:Transcript_59915/g.159475  ORF Transcript_59915/g.159475 Transcript_59915/m.159475 type:complete len:124 (-) Transcript_59915:3-374(-)